MQMRRIVPEWSGFDAPEHMVHLAPLPEQLPGGDDPLPPLVDPTEWLSFKTDKRRREHLGGRLLLSDSIESWWKQHASIGRADELDVIRDERRAPYLRWRSGLWRQTPLPGISIGHSAGRAVVGLVDEGWSIGVDAEPAGRSIAEGAWNMFASAEERESFHDKPEAALRAWVTKEAVQKALGLGMHLNPRHIVADGTRYIHNDAVVHLSWVSVDGMLMCVALAPGRAPPSTPEDAVLDATRAAMQENPNWGVGCKTTRNMS
tara:strand:- start:85 stop:867 length:783 start_codon:yes stop_codon:yes gene_type:complete